MRPIAVFMLFGGLFGCDTTYTLYRSSPIEESGRIHVATFDADESENYNRENCNLAARLFQAQPRVQTRFWCEKGAYR
jgi:hypothetical protein